MSDLTTVGKLIADLASNYDPGDPVMVRIGRQLPVAGRLGSGEVTTLNGTKRIVLILVDAVDTTCQTCNGSGRVAVGPWGSRPRRVPCGDCGGTGVVS